VVRNARYVAPTRPGYSISMKPESIEEYEFPAGRVWREMEMVTAP
jgi:L-fuconate dehydratase